MPRNSQAGGFPDFQLYWPESKRDDTIARCRQFLRQFGGDYQGPHDDSYAELIVGPDFNVAQFSIPPLGHPATPKDVQAGRALFSLHGKTRFWKMPSLPMGPVWQAEEIFEHGAWKRYYGIVADGRPVKVPAAEMDFSEPVSSAAVTKEINGKISRPPGRQLRTPINFMGVIENLLRVGEPVPVTISIRNHNGLDQKVPGSLMIPPGAAKTLPSGITLSATYSPNVPPTFRRFSQPPFDYGTFRPLPLRNDVTVSREKIDGPMLHPTEELPILNFDLGDFFDISRPGTYEIKAVFQVPGGVAVTSDPIRLSIAAAP
jgi:hypothetical protein